MSMRNFIIFVSRFLRPNDDSPIALLIPKKCGFNTIAGSGDTTERWSHTKTCSRKRHRWDPTKCATEENPSRLLGSRGSGKHRYLDLDRHFYFAEFLKQSCFGKHTAQPRGCKVRRKSGPRAMEERRFLLLLPSNPHALNAAPLPVPSPVFLWAEVRLFFQ